MREYENCPCVQCCTFRHFESELRGKSEKALQKSLFVHISWYFLNIDQNYYVDTITAIKKRSKLSSSANYSTRFASVSFCIFWLKSYSTIFLIWSFHWCEILFSEIWQPRTRLKYPHLQGWESFAINLSSICAKGTFFILKLKYSLWFLWSILINIRENLKNLQRKMSL